MSLWCVVNPVPGPRDTARSWQGPVLWGFLSTSYTTSCPSHMLIPLISTSGFSFFIPVPQMWCALWLLVGWSTICSLSCCTHGLSKSGDLKPMNVLIHPCLTLNSRFGAPQSLMLPHCSQYQPSKELGFFNYLSKQRSFEWIGLDRSRKLCLPCAHWSIYKGPRYTTGLSCTCVLPSHTCAYVGPYLWLLLNWPVQGMSMCVIPLMSVSDHVFRGRGI